MEWLDKQKALYQALAPFRYWEIVTSTVAFCVGYGTVLWWLSEKVDWPDGYGFHCRGRGCLWIELWHSPTLLKHGGSYETALFAVLWFIPATTLAIISVVLVRRRLRQRRDRIRPTDD